MLWDRSGAPSWFDWLSLVLTILGFVFAGIQAHKAKTAAEQAAAALNRASGRLATSQVTSLVAQLVEIAHDLDASRKVDDPNGAQRALRRLYILTCELAPLTEKLTQFKPETTSTIRELGDEASSAVEKIGSSKVPILPRGVSSISAKITLCQGELTKTLTRIRFDLEELDGNVQRS